MSSELVALHIVHVVSILALTAFTFFAFAAAPETRRWVLALAGISTLLVLISGFRMWQVMYHLAPLGWIIVKLVCWIGFTALAGLAYRKRERAGSLMLAGLVLLTVAVLMVYAKPF